MKGITSDQGRQTLEQFKMEAASEVGVNLKNGYNGDLTSRQAGSVGGQMVKKICPERKMTFTRSDIKKAGHMVEHTYIVGIAL